MSTHVTDPSPSATRRQRSRATRTLGDVVAVVVNAVLLVLVNVTPGWEAVPFLSPSAIEVVPLLNVALIVGIIGGLLDALVDRWWMRESIEIVSSTASLVFLITTWRVFPFVFADTSGLDWSLITRVILLVAAIGCVVSIFVQLVLLAARGTHWSAAHGG